jgi:hypothetical protein
MHIKTETVICGLKMWQKYVYQNPLYGSDTLYGDSLRNKCILSLYLNCPFQCYMADHNVVLRMFSITQVIQYNLQWYFDCE